MWRKTLVLKKIWRVARLGAGFFSTRDFEGTVITGATISNKQKYVEKKNALRWHFQSEFLEL